MSIRTALAYSFSTRYFAMGIQLLATVVLARLLTPGEIGIYSVGAAVIMIAHTLRDFGTSTYVIQEQNLTQARLGTAFAVTILVAWVLAMALWFASGPIAVFYNEAGVGEVMTVMALNFALIPFGSISMALLRRAMNFRVIMFIAVASAIVHSGTSVLFAAMGYGFISLAWGAVCGTLATVLGSLIANPAGFIMKPNLTELAHVLSFSMRSSVSSIAAEAGSSAPDIVLGRTVGMEGTGLFSRAMGYVQLFERLLQDVLRGVMLPYLADAERAGEDVRSKLNLILSNVVSISLFIIGLTAVLAQPLVVLLYGTQWEAAVPLAQTLCVAMALRCVSPTLAAALVAGGRINLVMKTTLISTTLKFALLIVSSSYGLLWGAIGFVAAEVINLIVLLHFSNQSGLFFWSDYASIFLKKLPVAVIGTLPAAVILIFLPLPASLVPLSGYLAAAGLTSVGLWLATLWFFDCPPKHELSRLLITIKRKLH